MIAINFELFCSLEMARRRILAHMTILQIQENNKTNRFRQFLAM